IVLSRLSVEDSIVIGVGHVDETDLSSNALPVQIDLSGEPNTLQLLERVEHAVAVAAARLSVKVDGNTIPAEKTDIAPYQAAFYSHNGLSQSPADYVSVECDLEVHLLQDKENAAVSIYYATALFNKETVERYAGYLKAVLANMVANGGHSVTTFDIMSPVEKTLLLETWNKTATEFPADHCIHQLFEQRVEKAPNNVAVIHGEHVLTYLELNCRANGLARQFVEADPKAPVERQAFIAKDSAAVLLVTDVKTEIPSLLNLPVLRIDADNLPSLEINVGSLRPSTSAQDTAYIMYTSGSTGLPKGVMVSHCGIARLVINNGFTDIGPDDSVAFSTNPSFDPSTFDVWAALVNGARMVIIDNDTYLDAHRLAEALSHYQ
ncbi:hypothetical protein BGZ80_007824, partial [Entomortierella chlamydospora]